MGWGYKETYGHWWHAYYMNVMPYMFPLNVYYNRKTAAIYAAAFA